MAIGFIRMTGIDIVQPARALFHMTYMAAKGWLTELETGLISLLRSLDLVDCAKFGYLSGRRSQVNTALVLSQWSTTRGNRVAGGLILLGHGQKVDHHENGQCQDLKHESTDQNLTESRRALTSRFLVVVVSLSSQVFLTIAFEFLRDFILIGIATIIIGWILLQCRCVCVCIMVGLGNTTSQRGWLKMMIIRISTRRLISLIRSGSTVGAGTSWTLGVKEWVNYWTVHVLSGVYMFIQ
jgi:hypothetical protein